MNLLLAPKDVDLKVLKIRTKRLDKQQMNHLQNLGFVEGADVRVISDVDGSVIVRVKGARIGLGRELAECIRVAA